MRASSKNMRVLLVKETFIVSSTVQVVFFLVIFFFFQNKTPFNGDWFRINIAFRRWRYFSTTTFRRIVFAPLDIYGARCSVLGAATYNYKLFFNLNQNKSAYFRQLNIRFGELGEKIC